MQISDDMQYRFFKNPNHQNTSIKDRKEIRPKQITSKNSKKHYWKRNENVIPQNQNLCNEFVSLELHLQ